MTSDAESDGCDYPTRALLENDSTKGLLQSPQDKAQIFDGCGNLTRGGDPNATKPMFELVMVKDPYIFRLLLMEDKGSRGNVETKPSFQNVEVDNTVIGKTGEDEDSQRVKYLRDGLNQFLKRVESRMHARKSVFDEFHRVMLQLDMTVDLFEFMCFYNFVFFMCREDGQKNITVSRVVAAWRLSLVGMFQLLNKWCNSVEENQHHNISEDTWQQVLIFSRWVHKNLQGFDHEGAWPVLIHDFVKHMYRSLGFNKDSNIFCCCVDLESQSCAYENTLHGLEVYLGMKRKLHESHDDDMKSALQFLNFPNLNCSLNSKRSKLIAHRSVNSLSKDFACMTMIDGALQAAREKYKQHKIKCAVNMPSCPEIPCSYFEYVQEVDVSFFGTYCVLKRVGPMALLENLAGNHILTVSNLFATSTVNLHSKSCSHYL
ncbi:hypothetical protein V6N11_082654 [Hibiscus sabdariffa]|uniref:Defective in cullin neddylation protein n=1 Tax=Hibiscus sabdariffa TaxID=183260 RepID=A0ABR2P9R8_9ROSI